MVLIRKGNNIITKFISKQPPMIFILTGSHLLPLLGKEAYLMTLVDRGYLIFSNIAHRKKEIDRLKEVLHEKFDYLNRVINQVLNEVKQKHKTSVNNVNEESQVSPVTELKSERRFYY